MHVQEEHTAQVDLLTAVHADQEALIADLSEQLSTSAARCAELDHQLGDLCGPPRSPRSGVLSGYTTRVAQLHAAEDLALQLTEQLTRAQVCSSLVRIQSFISLFRFVHMSNLIHRDQRRSADTRRLCFAQGELSQQGAVLDEKESMLHELERQKTHFEAKAALQERQQKAVVSRLEASCAAMTAEVSCR